MKLRVTKPPTPTSNDFNWGKEGDAIDSKAAANYLKQKGLVGADQIVEAQPNLADANSIRNNQGDWKVSAVQQILANAKKFNLRKPEEILANKNVLVGNPKWRDAINNPSFSVIHPNFWSTITDKILPEQYAKDDASKSIAQK